MPTDVLIILCDSKLLNKRTHGDFDVYNGHGCQLGSIDATNGELTKPAFDGGTIEVSEEKSSCRTQPNTAANKCDKLFC